MLSKTELNSAELETVRVAERPTTVFTASGSPETKDEATMYAKDVDFFVTVQVLDDTRPILSHGQLCEDHGDSSIGLNVKSQIFF